MTKQYIYKVTGKDGRGQHFEINGEVTCDYGQVWEVVNLDFFEKLANEGGVCPISVKQVSIRHLEI